MRRSGNFWPYGLPIPDHLVQMLNDTTFPVPQVWCDEQVLDANFDITGNSGVYQEVTGTATFALSLPDAGTYLIYGDVRAIADPDANAPGFISCKLYNDTLGAAVANSERFVCYNPFDGGTHDVAARNTISIHCLVRVTSATTIKLHAARNGATTTWTSSRITSDSDGRTVLGYLRLQ